MILSYRFLRRTRPYQRPVLTVLLFFLIFDALFQIAARPRTVRTPVTSHYTGRTANTAQRAAGNTTVFIVSVHRNTEDVLRAAWNPAMLDLVDHLGPENVYFSAIESGSQDKTKEALLELQGKLNARGVGNTVSLGMTVWEQLQELDAQPDPKKPREKGWIWNREEERYALRRIPYLSRVRNQAMEPLKALEKEGRRFDKVLWANDVVFDTEDFVTLLNTQNGAYAAACSMDFKLYPFYYDTFALRDDIGQKAVSLYWPWFLSPAARRSAQAMEPVSVKSCWNGMVIFDSTPFYADPPLAFRGIGDSLADMHLEASECCLIHADNVLSEKAGKGVWLNPNVRVGYNEAAYKAVRGAHGSRFPGKVAAVTGAWANRWLRWRGAVQQTLERVTVVNRLKQWRQETPQGETPRTEVGDACLINEMQIMWQNGWRHL